MYSGWPTVVDICSGDIALFLRVIRDIFSMCRDKDPSDCIRYAPSAIQDRAVRTIANEFLKIIQGAPETGERLKKIAEAFGEVANWQLRNLNSGNRKSDPPKQAFRIEILETPHLTGENLRLYNDLLKYGIFFRDARGKSLRGAVVPRLYLRRLLILSFKLTPANGTT